MRDRHSVSRPESARFDAPVVDPYPIGAPQVAAHDHASVRRDGAVVPGDHHRIDPGITFGMEADQQRGPIQDDIWPAIERVQASRHGSASRILAEAMAARPEWSDDP